MARLDQRCAPQPHNVAAARRSVSALHQSRVYRQRLRWAASLEPEGNINAEGTSSSIEIEKSYRKI